MILPSGIHVNDNVDDSGKHITCVFFSSGEGALLFECAFDRRCPRKLVLRQVEKLRNQRCLISGTSLEGGHREDEKPCRKCPELEERLLAEATRVNDMMRKIRDHQQEVIGFANI